MHLAHKYLLSIYYVPHTLPNRARARQCRRQIGMYPCITFIIKLEDYFLSDQNTLEFHKSLRGKVEGIVNISRTIL